MPKVYLLISIALCISLTCASLPTAPNCQRTSFREILKEKMNVTIFQEPTFEGDNKCAPEWKTHGSCCDFSSLAAYAVFDKERIAHATSKAQKYAVRLLNLVLELSRIEEEHKHAVVDDKSLSKILTIMGTIASDSRSKMRIDRLALHSGLIEGSMEGCWSHMAKVRSASLCGLCSASADHYFFGKTSKALIAADVCSEFLEKCSLSFQQTLDLIYLLSEFAKSFRDIDTSQSRELQKMVKMLDFVPETIKYLQEKQVLAKMDKYLGLVPGKHDLLVESSLCSKTLSLFQVPVISKFAVVFHTGYQMMMKVYLHLYHAGVIKGAHLPDWYLKSRNSIRLLTQSVSSKNNDLPKFDMSNLIVGDVQVFESIRNSIRAGPHHSSKDTSEHLNYSKLPIIKLFELP